MKVLIATTEMVPYAKTGGLADVAGALPAALRAQEGVAPAAFLPLWRGVDRKGLRPVAHLRVPVSTKKIDASVLEGTTPSGDRIFFLDAPQYFDRDGLYQQGGRDYDDNCERFVFFSRAVCEFLTTPIFPADVVHAHDWFGGLIPVYLKSLYADRVRPRPSTVFTIHNIAYQGLFWHYDWHLLGLPWSFFTYDRLEFYGKINLLKGGVAYADKVTTVSARYAEEIRTPAFGAGLDGLLAKRSRDLSGIQNGIDADAWNPATDPHLAARYDFDTIEEKARCKAELQEIASLPKDPKVPVLGFVGRLAEQKGLDLLLASMNDLLALGTQFVLLGTGEARYETQLRDLARREPMATGIFLQFSDPLARKVEAGVDYFLMPSRFEPSGLNQLYSMRYGTPPIVHRVGGLADTVEDGVTGFVFDEMTPGSFVEAVRRARELFSKTRSYRKMQKEGMSRDFSWARSAAKYVEVYRGALATARGGQ